MGSIKITIYVTLLFMSACGSKMDYLMSKPKNSKPFGTQKLEIKIPTTDGTILDLDKDPERPTLVIFSQEFCLNCLEEMHNIQKDIKDPTGIPTKINIYTFLVGATLEDAKDWQQTHHVRWPVGYDLDASVFHRFCPEQKVPCVMIHLPEKGVVFLEQRKTTIEELKQWTGSWEDSL